MGESSLLGPDMIYKTLYKVHIIKEPVANSLWSAKSYVDHRRRDLEFKEGDRVYLKNFPMKRVVIFGKKGN